MVHRAVIPLPCGTLHVIGGGPPSLVAASVTCRRWQGTPQGKLCCNTGAVGLPGSNGLDSLASPPTPHKKGAFGDRQFWGGVPHQRLCTRYPASFPSTAPKHISGARQCAALRRRQRRATLTSGAPIPCQASCGHYHLTCSLLYRSVRLKYGIRPQMAGACTVHLSGGEKQRVQCSTLKHGGNHSAETWPEVGTPHTMTAAALPATSPPLRRVHSPLF